MGSFVFGEIVEQALQWEVVLADDRVIPEADEIRRRSFESVTQGKYEEALKIIIEGLEKYPTHFNLQTDLATVLGDHSGNFEGLEKEAMIEKSKQIFDALMSIVTTRLDRPFFHFKNEYYYRFEMYEEQYNNGVKHVETYWGTDQWLPYHAFWGYYCQGVGAARFAAQCWIEGNRDLAIDYAQKALVAWAQFFSYHNTYYNAYVHYGLALGILGRRDEMEKALKHGAGLINQDLNHIEFKEIIDFFETFP
jgi:tetratricopeptide (TPR) repeat protein